MKESITSLQETWESLSKTDPLWAILSDPRHRGGQWDLKSFFETGEQEVATLVSYLATIHYKLPELGPAVDFGCGVGRLSRAIAHRVSPVIGIDIAQGMIDQAKKLNPDESRFKFICNASTKLPLADAQVRFLYSSIVVQHIPRPMADAYIGEFVRVLASGGLAVFQIFDSLKPEAPKTLTRRWQQVKTRLALRTRVRRLLGVNKVEDATIYKSRHRAYTMNILPEVEVRRLVEAAGGRVIDVRWTNSTDSDFNGRLRYLDQEPMYGHISKQFVVTR